ncbi:MAG: hypothetical protein CMP05_10965 [Xanthomarina sp.]|nr:hypothetical protein [Xanthomarina sp.]MAL23299.1 hypothetical protein [Xanthomarina sp.]MBF62504.1 hypothetical protein [Xanthomarina sp.]HAB27647.1 hypothetical protein [Xanthomarina gelatinilytica]|tara:strand:+ start:990 stop:1571 length:582 start_codon:yes stop_codon:yes gene_type:complete
MKQFIFLLVIATIGIVSISCNGRDRVFKTNTEVLIENKLLDSFSENITYVPETYTEVATDTILYNGFHVKLKTYTIMDKHIVNEFKQDSIVYKKYYREFVTDVIVTKNDKEIFNERIDKEFIHKHNNNLQLNKAIINVMVNQVSSVKNHGLVLSAMIKDIQNETITFCDILIDSEGNLVLKEVQELYAFNEQT